MEILGTSGFIRPHDLLQFQEHVNSCTNAKNADAGRMEVSVVRVSENLEKEDKEGPRD